MAVSERRTRAFWVCAIITAVSAIVSASFAVAGVFRSSPPDTYALYAASRSISLPLVVLGCLWFRSRAGIVAMALTMGLVQLFDGVIGVLSHDANKTYGPLVLAIAAFVSAAKLLRSAENS